MEVAKVLVELMIYNMGRLGSLC